MKSREDIVKGLECCLHAGEFCEECPYCGEEDQSKWLCCSDLLLSHALELIKSDGERLEAPVITEGKSKEELLGDTCGETEQASVVAPKQCEDCVHYPICEWCNENTTEFNWREDGDTSDCAMRMPYSMFKVHSFDETADGMLSGDYKERFKAEYQQTKIRYERLKAFNNEIEAAHRTACHDSAKKVEMPAHDCPMELLREQQGIMGSYLHILEVRAIIEGIEL